MISFFTKYKNIFLVLTVVFFIGSLGFVGAGVFMEEYGPNSAIAKVGEVKIKYRDYSNAVSLMERQARSSDKEYTEETSKKIEKEVLQSLINQESLSQAAKQFGIGVSDAEIGYAIKNSELFGKNGLFTKKAYIWIVRNNFGMNPAQYEETLKKQKLAEKFQNMIVLSAKVTPQELEFLQQTQVKKIAADQKSKDAFALAALELKAQSLMDKYTDQFTAQNHIEIFKKEQTTTQE